MIKLRQYQRQCVDAFYQYYQKYSGHGLIVVPTAGGKSLIIGTLATEIVQQWPTQRILVLSHVKELIQQNHAKIMLCWDKAPAGIYSASLKRRQAHHPIVVASVQSVYQQAALLGHRDLIFIDEAHLLQPGNMGMYNELLCALKAINPKLKICGFTATDYRMDMGTLTGGSDAIFNDVIIDIPMKYLLEEGYLTPPIGKSSIIQADLDGVKHVGGEFNIRDMAARFDQKAFMEAALDNDLQFFEGRNTIALFCATVENAQHVADAMCARGIETEVVHGAMLAAEREDKLKRFSDGCLRGLASVGVITTGTDIPNIDCIVLFRATESPGLYQQIIGRGFRVVYGAGFDLSTKEGRLDAISKGQKPNFLVLDHGGNINRHGPITGVKKPIFNEKGKRVKSVKAQARICEICRTGWPLEATVCSVCGADMVIERDPTANLNLQASNLDIMGTPFSRGERGEWFDVRDVVYKKFTKSEAPDAMKVTYYCGLNQFNVYLNFDGGRFQKIKAFDWWNKHAPAGYTIEEITSLPATALALDFSPQFKKPTRILVVKRDTHFEVLNHEFHPVQSQRADFATASGA